MKGSKTKPTQGAKTGAKTGATASSSGQRNPGTASTLIHAEKASLTRIIFLQARTQRKLS